MDITWYGLSCFRLSERNHASVVTDPFNAKIGLTLPKMKAEVVTQSHIAPGHDNAEGVQGVAHTLTGPGEYEIGNVFISGIATRSAAAERNIMFRFDFNGVAVAHPGDLTKVPTQSQIEALGSVNVLLLPIGGGNSLNAVQAAELVSMIEPSIVIPMHYATDGLKLDLDGPERFLQEVGAEEVEPLASLRVASGSLAEETQIVLLTPKQ